MLGFKLNHVGKRRQCSWSDGQVRDQYVNRTSAWLIGIIPAFTTNTEKQTQASALLNSIHDYSNVTNHRQLDSLIHTEKDIEPSHNWPYVTEITCDWWIPFIKGQ